MQQIMMVINAKMMQFFWDCVYFITKKHTVLKQLAQAGKKMEKQRKIIFEKVKYRELSFWLKLAVIGGWIVFFEFIIYFFIGFFGAI